MQGKAKRRIAAGPGLSGRPAWAAFLLVGAGVAVAHPIDGQKQPGGLTQRPLPAPVMHAATVRIVLPAPADVPSRTVGLLDPAKRERNSGKLAELAPAPAKLSVSPAPALPIASSAPTQALAAARTGSGVAVSPAAYDMADTRDPRPISMVGDDSWAEMTRPYGAASQTVSATDRVAALQPPKTNAKPISGAVPIVTDAPQPATDAALAAAEAAVNQQSSAEKVSFEVTAKVNGTAAGRVRLSIRDEANIAVRLVDLLSILKPRIDAGLYDRLAGSQAAQGQMTLNELRASGIAVHFDDRDRLVIGLP